ncbi:hypothetical protein CHELA40_15118 [Chelatococcus asaccharovorans]|nr:hypothetical protein CHELA17_60502 [Chelatococcus asaccharovorans]CAH1681556.1 hypothetical protein CHELA40_15118 [Chelatococcus asaccharovorans]
MSLVADLICAALANDIHAGAQLGAARAIPAIKTNDRQRARGLTIAPTREGQPPHHKGLSQSQCRHALVARRFEHNKPNVNS